MEISTLFAIILCWAHRNMSLFLSSHGLTLKVFFNHLIFPILPLLTEPDNVHLRSSISKDLPQNSYLQHPPSSYKNSPWTSSE